MADAYNKYTKQTAGTLVGNWQEERELRDLTGHGRSYPTQHVPYRNGDPTFMREREGTETRIHGTEHPLDTLNTFNYEYGKATNPADNLPKLGKREQLLASQIYNEVHQEHLEKLEVERKEKEARAFETTTKSNFNWKTTEGTVGKRVMKDQNGREVNLSDAEFAVEHGFRRIQPITDIATLQEEVKSKEMPVTLYSESLDRQTIPVSSNKGANPFARACGFTQPIQLTRAANSFQGNI